MTKQVRVRSLRARPMLAVVLALPLLLPASLAAAEACISRSEEPASSNRSRAGGKDDGADVAYRAELARLFQDTSLPEV